MDRADIALRGWVGCLPGCGGEDGHGHRRAQAADEADEAEGEADGQRDGRQGEHQAAHVPHTAALWITGPRPKLGQAQNKVRPGPGRLAGRPFTGKVSLEKGGT